MSTDPIPQTTVTNTAPPLEVKAEKKPAPNITFTMVRKWAYGKWKTIGAVFLGAFAVIKGVLWAYSSTIPPLTAKVQQWDAATTQIAALTAKEDTTETRTSFWHENGAVETKALVKSVDAGASETRELKVKVESLAQAQETARQDTRDNINALRQDVQGLRDAVLGQRNTTARAPATGPAFVINPFNPSSRGDE